MEGVEGADCVWSRYSYCSESAAAATEAAPPGIYCPIGRHCEWSKWSLHAQTPEVVEPEELQYFESLNPDLSHLNPSNQSYLHSARRRHRKSQNVAMWIVTLDVQELQWHSTAAESLAVRQRARGVRAAVSGMYVLWRQWLRKWWQRPWSGGAVLYSLHF